MSQDLQGFKMRVIEKLVQCEENMEVIENKPMSELDMLYLTALLYHAHWKLEWLYDVTPEQFEQERSKIADELHEWHRLDKEFKEEIEQMGIELD